MVQQTPDNQRLRINEEQARYIREIEALPALSARSNPEAFLAETHPAVQRFRVARGELISEVELTVAMLQTERFPNMDELRAFQRVQARRFHELLEKILSSMDEIEEALRPSLW